MGNSPFRFLLIGVMLLLDLYVFQVVKVVAQSAGPKTKSVIYISYWVLSILAIGLMIVLPYLDFEAYPKGLRSILFAFVIALFFGKLITALFLFIDDIRRGIQWTGQKIFFNDESGRSSPQDNGISRSVFLSWLGLAVGGGLFGSLVYGFSNKYNYGIKKVSLAFQNLPAAFKGFKIVQISDVHSGSFTNKPAVQQGIDKILELRPDLILFTGDLVNNKAEEMKDYIDVFSQLRAPMGVYSVLGNHDYGDYVEWSSLDEKKENLDRLKNTHALLGWKLMQNEHAILKKDGQEIALLGVENWSAKARFPKHGRLKEAYSGTEQVPFKILMSHDPSHWDAEVRKTYSDIDLMLSGHTHGMQFGVEIPWLKWSPVQYVYRQWAGLYERGAQKLYVNRGFGFIGYPGRVGILPEITLIELA
ncbi:MAG: metallophosphoesterase [Chitinophagaceae bacterium]